MNDFYEFGADADEGLDADALVDWDQIFMRQACGLAEQAASEDEVPVGAVIVRANRVIGAGWNQREALMDPTAHAEMIAITQAAAALESWRLEECTMYVTLETLSNVCGCDFAVADSSRGLWRGGSQSRGCGFAVQIARRSAIESSGSRDRWRHGRHVWGNAKRVFFAKNDN